MAKDKATDRKAHKDEAGAAADGGVTAPAKLGNGAYEQELRKLHVELVKLQEWVQRTGAKVCILCEGRDGSTSGDSTLMPRSVHAASTVPAMAAVVASSRLSTSI